MANEAAAELAALREKYQQIAALREARARARTEPGSAEPDPGRALAALSARFPGALRELDELPLSTVYDRIAALRDAEADPRRTEPWMSAQILFHAAARGALAAKRWLAGRRHVDDAMRAAFLRESAGLPFPEDARAWAPELDRVARPPRGRLTLLVHARVGAALGIDAREARRLVFGSARDR